MSAFIIFLFQNNKYFENIINMF